MKSLAALALLLPFQGVRAASPDGPQPDHAVGDSTRLWTLDNTEHLALHGVSATVAVYRGRKSVRLVESAGTTPIDRDRAVAFIDNADFRDGTIELWVAGAVRPDAADTSVRGFVGVAFRGTPETNQYENFYLRPTNGRSSDQVRRNHAVQYESMPDYPWFRLRRESAGGYEAYVDLQPGVWTKMKLVVAGTRAQLFVNDASQPSLIVNDLKLGNTHGLIGLWIGPGTEAYFSELRVSGGPPSLGSAMSPDIASARTGSDVRLDSTTKVELSNAAVRPVEYRGRHALKLVPLPGHERAMNEQMQAVLTETDFKDGAIEIDVAGARREGYSTAEDLSGFKGMIGLSFRVQGNKAERFYVRPQNARLENQLFRNFSTQYESVPDFPWDLLREKSPAMYESYVDLEPGAWTRLRIEVSGTEARLYVNGATQPCLVVNDLKSGVGRGKLALWSRVSTEAYFSNLKVYPVP